MNNKGSVTVSLVIIIAIALIVGAVFLRTAAQQVGDTTNTITVVNETYTAGANGASFYLTNYRALSSPVIHNASGGEVIAAGNYTITNNVVYNGALAVKVTVDDAEYQSMNWNISGTAQPLTYIAESGGRSVATLVVIFFALAIALVALYPVYEGKLWQLIGK